MEPQKTYTCRTREKRTLSITQTCPIDILECSNPLPYWRIPAKLKHSQVSILIQVATSGISQINFGKFQQGCETDQHNVARNNQDQKLGQTLKTLSKQDLYIIEHAINVYRNKIIQGTSCHLREYITDKMENTQGGWPFFHRQTKTFHYMNHDNQTSYKWNGENMLKEDINPWMMDIDNQ